MADFDDIRFRRKRLRDDPGLRFRELLSFQSEGPLPPRPHRSGKGGPSVGQGTVPPPVTSVWSASDASANAMTLSNGGLTVTPSGSGTWGSIRGSTSKTSGKLYIEFKTSAAVAVGTGFNVLGLASAGFNSVDVIGNNNYSIGFEIVRPYTTTSTGFTAITNGMGTSSLAVNDVVAIAVDFTAQLMWIAYNNVWHTSLDLATERDPATGTLPNGTFVAATVGALFPAMSFIFANAGVWTMQATAASQKYAPPSGFTAWG